jgi:uncharacterized protein
VALNLMEVKIDKPESVNVIIGQCHFIKSVEDLHEALITAVPGIQFGLAFTEASGPCLIRSSGSEPEMISLATTAAQRLACGHVFVIMLKNCFPINVMVAVRGCVEVCSIFAATANPLTVVVAENEQGRGVMGVIDGVLPKGVESPADVEARRGFLRKIGYKL